MYWCWLRNKAELHMNKIYSSRGARRGLLIAAVTMGAWSAWAIGYSQGVETQFPQMPLISVNQEQIPKVIQSKK